MRVISKDGKNWYFQEEDGKTFTKIPANAEVLTLWVTARGNYIGTAKVPQEASA